MAKAHLCRLTLDPSRIMPMRTGIGFDAGEADCGDGAAIRQAVVL